MSGSMRRAEEPRAETELEQARKRISHLEELVRDLHQSEAFLKKREANYRSLFVNSPVSLWEEDFSRVKVVLDRLRGEGVSDLEAYFISNPDVLEQCARSIVIKDVNKATIKLYEAVTKEQLLGTLDKLMVPESMNYFIAELVTLAGGETFFEGEIEHFTLKGQRKMLSVSLSLAPGHEKTWDRVYVAIVDITEKRRVETERLHREKLQGVVETAGAASHDLNQPLQTIVGQLELLLLNLDQGPENIRRRVETVFQEIDRITDITRKLSRITSAESTDYVLGEKILDLDRSTGG